MKKSIIIGLIISVFILIGCSNSFNRDDMVPISEPLFSCSEDSYSSGVNIPKKNNDGITDYYTKRTEYRTYRCSDVAKDYWRYPSYDKAFNRAYENCNKTCHKEFQEAFKKEKIPYNESLFINKTFLISDDRAIGNFGYTGSTRTIIYGMNTTFMFTDMDCVEIECSCDEWSCPSLCLNCKSTLNHSDKANRRKDNEKN